ncbi:MAG: hypothetical protein WCD21_44260 [Streptomyces sp.]
MGAGDDILIDRLLTGFTQLADIDALIHLRTRLHTTLRATTGRPPPTTLPLPPGRSPLRGTGSDRVVLGRRPHSLGEG